MWPTLPSTGENHSINDDLLPQGVIYFDSIDLWQIFLTRRRKKYWKNSSLPTTTTLPNIRDFFDDSQVKFEINDFYSRDSRLWVDWLVRASSPCIISKKKNIPISIFRKKKRKKEKLQLLLTRRTNKSFLNGFTLYYSNYISPHYPRFSTGVNY